LYAILKNYDQKHERLRKAIIYNSIISTNKLRNEDGL